MAEQRAEVVVIGAGFAGLSAALHLAEAGVDVVVCEALSYAGGCASTFTRQGHRYESGATMFAGFAEGQWMHSWIERFGLDVTADLLDPVIAFRSPEQHWVVPAEREAFIEMLTGLPGAPAAGIRGFFRDLVSIADPLWRVFDDPGLLPPVSATALWTHATRLPSYLPVLRATGRPLAHLLHRHGVQDFEPLVTWLDAVCQITVQTSADRAEAPIAAAAVDYFFRGTAHIQGGIGALADACVKAIERLGGRVLLSNRVQALRLEGNVWHLDTRKGSLQADQVLANLLPQNVDQLRGINSTGWLPEAVHTSWGAAMLYLQVVDDLPAGSHHAQCVGDPSRPLVEGNHVLVSLSPREGSQRSVTVSTHLPLLEADVAEQVARVQQTMRNTLRDRMPELEVVSELTASPRTFERFTRREAGRVGGIPRVAGWRNYRQLWPLEHAPGLWLIGDSTFPGQSVLAVAIGGHRAAVAVRRRRGRP